MNAARVDIEVTPVGPSSPARWLEILDGILRGAAPALVGADERLEPMAERLLDAATDPARILLCAHVTGEPVGLIDGFVHVPEPGVLTIAQLAVGAPHRFRGVGRALVEAAVADAAARGAPVSAMAAAVRARAAGALAFWASLGLEELGRAGGVRQLGRPV